MGMIMTTHMIISVLFKQAGWRIFQVQWYSLNKQLPITNLGQEVQTASLLIGAIISLFLKKKHPATGLSVSKNPLVVVSITAES